LLSLHEELTDVCAGVLNLCSLGLNLFLLAINPLLEVTLFLLESRVRNHFGVKLLLELSFLFFALLGHCCFNLVKESFHHAALVREEILEFLRGVVLERSTVKH
jgi:hypothetical protein